MREGPMLAGKIQEIEAHSRGWLTKLECVELKGSVSLRGWSVVSTGGVHYTREGGVRHLDVFTLDPVAFPRRSAGIGNPTG